MFFQEQGGRFRRYCKIGGFVALKQYLIETTKNCAYLEGVVDYSERLSLLRWVLARNHSIICGKRCISMFMLQKAPYSIEHGQSFSRRIRDFYLAPWRGGAKTARFRFHECSQGGGGGGGGGCYIATSRRLLYDVITTTYIISTMYCTVSGWTTTPNLPRRSQV